MRFIVEQASNGWVVTGWGEPRRPIYTAVYPSNTDEADFFEKVLNQGFQQNRLPPQKQIVPQPGDYTFNPDAQPGDSK